MLPPSRAAWIPGRHGAPAVMRNIVDYRSLYFRQDLAALLPAQVRVIDVSPLLQAVLEPIALACFDQTWERAGTRTCWDFAWTRSASRPANRCCCRCPMTGGSPGWVTGLDRLPPELKTLEADVGASAKTITRIFQRQTGTSLTSSRRQQWRLDAERSNCWPSAAWHLVCGGGTAVFQRQRVHRFLQEDAGRDAADVP